MDPVNSSYREQPNINLPNQTVPQTSVNSIIFLLVAISVFFIGSIGYLAYQNQVLENKITYLLEAQKYSTPVISPQITENPTPTSYIITPTTPLTVTPTNTPKITPSNTPIITNTPTPSPINIAEDAKLIRNLIAEFQKYNGTKNTAGALNFFTPPTTNEDKIKLSQIRTKNLNYTINNWYYYANKDEDIFTNPTQSGYKILLNEGRDGVQRSLVMELVKVGNNYFIDRYYHHEAILNTTSIKYQGFDL